MARGRVKKWLGAHAKGWVIDDADGEECFFTDRSLRGLRPEDLHPGLEVEFDRESNERGPTARNVRRVGAPAGPPGPPRREQGPPRQRESGGRQPADVARPGRSESGGRREQAPRGPGVRGPGPRPEQGPRGPDPQRGSQVAYPRRDIAVPSPQLKIPEPAEEVPLPRSTQGLLGEVGREDRHPGLLLDKYPKPGGQEQQHLSLQAVVRTPGDHILFAEVRARHEEVLRQLGLTTWERTTNTALTLHLARPSALENAGLSLHPLYGFAWLPATGLKGLARAYAETIWLPSQPEGAREAGEQLIQQIFGTASSQEAGAAGAVVFHDAWPVEWPKLVVDIVNNHHCGYYEEQRPPGDWDSPVPVYFLAVQVGTPFRLALGLRRSDAPGELLSQARAWLDDGLTLLGCGAKTGAGYGTFASTQRPKLPPGWAEETADLELVTPAFLAGADQQADDCDLRPATLRGLLRWWWRSLHAGFLSPRQLSLLEAALWGDTHSSGAIQILVTPVPENPLPELFDYKDRFRPIPAFQQAHHLAEPPDGKTTQGLFYLSYGMDEGGQEGRHQRFYRPPGCRWKVTVWTRPACHVSAREPEASATGSIPALGSSVAHASGSRSTSAGSDRPAGAASDPEQRQQGQTIPAAEVLDQALTALWLLGHFGGVGSKSRNGFGSLQVQFAGWREPNLVDCLEFGRALRQRLALPQEFVPRQAESSALAEPERDQIELTTHWTDPWFGLDQVGFAYQGFAQKYKHSDRKRSLGLPRKIHGPNPAPFAGQDRTSHQPPRWLVYPGVGPEERPQEVRHASPVHIHLSRGEGGTLTVRVLAFPAARLPDRTTSAAFLKEFLQFLRQELSITGRATPGRPVPRPTPAGSARRDPGTVVRVTVLEPHTKLGPAAFFVQEEGRGRGLLSVGKPPAQLPEPGSVVQVYISSDDQRSPQYRWDLPPDLGGEAGPRRERRPPRPGGRR